MSKTKTKPQYDNSYSGALYTTPDSNILEGPYQTDKEGYRIRAVLGKPGEQHELEVHKIGKDGRIPANSKPIGVGSFVRNENADVVSAKGNLPPVGKGSLTFAKGKDVVSNLWRASNSTDGSKFLQIKPNLGGNRDVSFDSL